jgi:O-succinylbenzoic acid--CoA ligase
VAAVNTFRIDWLAAQAQAAPRAVALITPQGRWTYAALDAAVDAACARLAALGLRQGDRAALHGPNDGAAVILVHACARMGIVAAPLNTRLAPVEVGEQMRAARPALLICESPAVAAAAHPFVERCFTRADFDALAPAAFTAPPFDVERDQAIVFTSGSAGAPKGVRLTFANHLWSAVGSAARLGASPDDHWLSVLPLFHVGGLAVLFRAALFGFTVTLLPRFDPDDVGAALVQTQLPVTLVSLVPTMLKRLLDQGWQAAPALRCVLLGGAAADETLLARARATGVPVAATYGMTEAASQIATQTLRDAHAKPLSVGRPLAGTRVRICDEHGNDMPACVVGEIVVSGQTVMPGYFENPEADARALRRGELCTGDLGYRDADGDLFVLQRRSDLIISGGENVYPAEVERVLRAHPSVADALVVGAPDAEWGQRVAALLVPHANATIDVDDVLRHARSQLAGYKLPRIVRVVHALPLLSNGKLDRKAAERQVVQTIHTS